MRGKCVLAALFAAPLFAYAQDAVPFDWQGEIRPDQSLEIRNINGSILAEPAEGSQVEIHVRISGTTPPPQTIRIDVSQHPDRILACTIYEGISVPDYCAPDLTPSVSLQNSNIRVEYRVRVPAGIALVAKTVNGRVSAFLPQSALLLETVNGRIVLSSAKHACARTVNGSIVASLSGLDGPSAFRTVNGTVDVDLDESVRATVEGRTVLGWITTDFPLHVHRGFLGFIGSRFGGDLNGGGPSLLLETVNGSLHLHKEFR